MILNPGLGYKLFIDPLLRKVHLKVSALVSEEDTVIDVACGNGTLSSYCSERARSVIGIDLDADKISYAKRRIAKKGYTNIEFLLMDARDMSRFEDSSIHTAVISMAIHQFSLDTAYALLKEISRITERILIIDYNFPLPHGIAGAAAQLIERLAGEEHHNNFQAYMALGGIKKVFSEAGLQGTMTEHHSKHSVFTVIQWRKEN